MKAKIGRGELTTEHPASSRGIPVYVLDGMAYGPDDNMDGHLAGSCVIVSDDITMRKPSHELVAAVCRWLGQSAQHGLRWVESVKRAQAASYAEFADEGTLPR
jgi:hypothetical protein